MCCSAHALSELCWLDEPSFYDPTKAYVTLWWVSRRLVKCLVHRHGKGESRKDTNMGGGGGGGGLGLGAPWRVMHVPHREKVAVGSLTSLNIFFNH